eukprot:11191027-Lingulodinium_polyedra.AAC.1
MRASLRIGPLNRSPRGGGRGTSACIASNSNSRPQGRNRVGLRGRDVRNELRPAARAHLDTTGAARRSSWKAPA